MKRLPTLVFAPSLLSALFSHVAQAQLEEIVVTAERREASLQEIPVAVTALSAEMMEVKQVSNVRDLQYQVPNISIATNTGTANGARLFLRGVGEDESRATAEPAVSLYVDGIYLGRAVGSMVDLLDLERIEVLRGPQGTLYGRNSNAGAIKLVSKKPSTEGNSGDLKLTLGNEDRLDVKASGNLALSNTTALRISVLDRRRDGFHTLNPNGDFADEAGTVVGDVDNTAVRVALQHLFNDSWLLNLAVDQTQDDSDPIPDSAQPGNDADNDLFTIEPLPETVCSAATPSVFLPIGCFTDYASEVESGGVSLDIAGDLGNYSLNFLSGYRELEDKLSSRIGFPYTQETDQDQFSQEVTITSDFGGNFDFVAGVYYFQEDVQLDSVFVAPFAIGVETEAMAVFFQSSLLLADDWTLTSGLRQTEESKDLEAFALSSGLARVESEDFSNTSYRLALDYQINDQVMSYLSLSTGFKSGGWSPDCFADTACFLPVEEEEVETIELGLRSDLLDNTLRFNATYFFNDYEGLQIAATVPGLGFTRFNVDETEIQGLEFELTYQPTESLTINAVLGWLDGEYKSLTEDQASALTNSGATPACNGVATVECAKSLELKNAPEYKGTLGAAYTASLANGSLTTSIDFSLEDTSWSLVANDPPHALTDVDTLVNARVAYTSADDTWGLALWGQNLTDEEYARAAAAGSFTQYASLPLTWGVDLEYSF